MQKQYTLKEAAKLLNMSITLLRDKIKKGYVKAKKYEGSNRLYISEEEINRVQDNMR